MDYTEQYNVSFRCFYDNDGVPHYNNHYAPQFPISDIPRWIDSYKFTHPTCTSMSCKIWFVNSGGPDCASDDDD